jgi:hypothetical protein
VAPQIWHYVLTSLLCGCFSICDLVVQVVAWTLADVDRSLSSNVLSIRAAGEV